MVTLRSMLKKGYEFLAKAETKTTSRPPIMQPYMSTDTNAKVPIFPFPLIMIYELADNIDALRIPIEAINFEMFKNGFKVVETFKWRCNNCGKDFEYKPLGKDVAESMTIEGLDENDHDGKEKARCDECDSDDVRRPKPENRKILKHLIDYNINGNRQKLMDVMRQIERDLEVADAGYMLLLNSYEIDDKTGKINHEKTQIKEIIRIEPPEVGVIADSDGRLGFDDKRNPVYICPFFEHRNKSLPEPVCREHDIPVEALRAVIEVNSVYSLGVPQPKRVMYAQGEVIFKPGKYKPGMIYGYSPIYGVWSKAMALSHMDEYLRKYFDKMRPPRGLLVISSRNYETFKKAWEDLEVKATEDPYMIHPLMVENEKGGRNVAQWLSFTGSMQELQFTEVRAELRQIVGAAYGILPLYFGETPSGWQNEGLEVTITNRRVKFYQRFLEEGYLDELAKTLGVDDWRIVLEEGDEADELRQLQIDAQKIQNYQQLQSMGFEVAMTHSGEWKSSKEPTGKQMQSMMGMDMQGKGGKRGPSALGDKERTKPVDGAPMNKRPSDPGGQAQGHPVPGGSKSSAFNASNKSDNTLMEVTKPIKGHTWDYWDKKLDDDGYDEETRGKIIGSWEKEAKKSGDIYYPTVSDDVEVISYIDKSNKKRQKLKYEYIVRDSDDEEENTSL